MYPRVAFIFESTQRTRTRAVETVPAGTSLGQDVADLIMVYIESFRREYSSAAIKPTRTTVYKTTSPPNYHLELRLQELNFTLPEMRKNNLPTPHTVSRYQNQLELFNDLKGHLRSTYVVLSAVFLLL